MLAGALSGDWFVSRKLTGSGKGLLLSRIKSVYGDLHMMKKRLFQALRPSFTTAAPFSKGNKCFASRQGRTKNRICAVFSVTP